ncbi:hypothetical protein [Microbispora bryophytorum]|uniref:hypothetical protein n=1 Tax=Microbispora bryophytorum TaxID=1460882 RepID=UPI0033DEDFA5
MITPKPERPRVRHEALFVRTEVTASTGGRSVFAKDKTTGELVWQVAVMDADPAAKLAQKTVAVKIIAPVQPVPPTPTSKCIDGQREIANQRIVAALAVSGSKRDCQ